MNAVTHANQPAALTAAHLAAFATATIACGQTVLSVVDKRNGSTVDNACTVEMLDNGDLRIRLEYNFFCCGKKAREFAIESIKAVFAALKADGITFRSLKRFNPYCGQKTVWQHIASGSGLSWAVVSQYADIRISA